MFRLFLVLFGIAFSFSQNSFNSNGERHGLWKGYHENGSIKYVGEFINGKESGVFKYYDYAGNIVIKLNYIEAGVKSEVILYYDNGVVKATGLYVDREKNGIWIYNNLNGEKISEENYLNDKLNGECIFFYKNGKISEKYNYLNGLKEGEGYIYYQSGFINMTCNYHMDKLDGDASFYYDDINQLESKGKYKMGLKDSVWVFFNEKGEFLRSIDYRKNN